MSSLALKPELLDLLSQPGPRLEVIGNWLLDLWCAEKYPHEDAVAFLREREEAVNRVETLVAGAASRLYEEFQAGVPLQRDLLQFLLQNRPCAAVVFDGLSLREIPAILSLAEQSGLRVVEHSFSFAGIPSETNDFVAQRLGMPAVSPSQLPSRRELRDRGIRTYYLADASVRDQFDRDADALLIWSAFPDVSYRDSGARFADHFAHLDSKLRLAWMNTVQAIPPGRKILVTSDHGYVFFGAGLSLPRGNQELTAIVQRFGGQRNARLKEGEAPLIHRDVAVMQVPDDGRVVMLRGRVQTHAAGPYANALYKHGGLSLMEMFTPWIVLDGKPMSDGVSSTR